MPEKIVWMSPDEVLRKMPPLGSISGESALVSFKLYGTRYFAESSLKFLKKKYPTKKSLMDYLTSERGTPIMLHFGSMWDVKGKKYPTHEGRHTALYAKMLGIKEIPVVIRGK
jgi:hypothetical protein